MTKYTKHFKLLKTNKQTKNPLLSSKLEIFVQKHFVFCGVVFTKSELEGPFKNI